MCECPAGKYDNGNSEECLSCSVKCKACDGPGDDSCTDCDEGLYLVDG